LPIIQASLFLSVHSRGAMIRKKSVPKTEDPVVPRFALVLVTFLSVSLISVLLLQRLTEPASKVDSGTFDLVEATQEFIGGDDMNITARNLRVHIPRNSISRAKPSGHGRKCTAWSS
jgi:hypothetical protein